MTTSCEWEKKTCQKREAEGIPAQRDPCVAFQSGWQLALILGMKWQGPLRGQGWVTLRPLWHCVSLILEQLCHPLNVGLETGAEVWAQPGQEESSGNTNTHTYTHRAITRVQTPGPGRKEGDIGVWHVYVWG